MLPFIVIPWLPLDLKYKKVNGSAVIIYVTMVSALPYIIPSAYKQGPRIHICVISKEEDVIFHSYIKENTSILVTAFRSGLFYDKYSQYTNYRYQELKKHSRNHPFLVRNFYCIWFFNTYFSCSNPFSFLQYENVSSECTYLKPLFSYFLLPVKCVIMCYSCYLTGKISQEGSPQFRCKVYDRYAA